MDPDRAFRAQISDKRAYFLTAAATIVLLAVVGVGLLPADGVGGHPSLADAVTPTPKIQQIVDSMRFD